jgi:hypothetical protein
MLLRWQNLLIKRWCSRSWRILNLLIKTPRYSFKVVCLVCVQFGFFGGMGVFINGIKRRSQIFHQKRPRSYEKDPSL